MGLILSETEDTPIYFRPNLTAGYITSGAYTHLDEWSDFMGMRCSIWDTPGDTGSIVTILDCQNHIWTGFVPTQRLEQHKGINQPKLWVPEHIMDQHNIDGLSVALWLSENNKPFSEGIRTASGMRFMSRKDLHELKKQENMESETQYKKIATAVSTAKVRNGNILLQDMEDTFEKCLAVAKAKNSDYGGSAKNPYNNFMNAIAVGVSVERGILVRMMDKMSRISTLLEKEAQVKDESINDTIEDLINYAAILKSYRQNN